MKAGSGDPRPAQGREGKARGRATVLARRQRCARGCWPSSIRRRRQPARVLLLEPVMPPRLTYGTADAGEGVVRQMRLAGELGNPFPILVHYALSGLEPCGGRGQEEGEP